MIPSASTHRKSGHCSDILSSDRSKSSRVKNHVLRTSTGCIVMQELSAFDNQALGRQDRAGAGSMLGDHLLGYLGAQRRPGYGCWMAWGSRSIGLQDLGTWLHTQRAGKPQYALKARRKRVGDRPGHAVRAYVCALQEPVPAPQRRRCATSSRPSCGGPSGIRTLDRRIKRPLSSSAESLINCHASCSR